MTTPSAATRSRRLAGLTRWWHMRGVRVDDGLILSDRLWNGWMRAYATADPTKIEQPQLRCPGCRSAGLRLVYTGGSQLGYALMWCPACNTGICPRRCAIPADAPCLPWSMSDDQRAMVIDDYQFVWPRHDEPLLRRWSCTAAAALALGLGAILAAAAATALLDLPGVTALLLSQALPVVFTCFGIVSAVSLCARRLVGRDFDHAGTALPPHLRPHLDGVGEWPA